MSKLGNFVEHLFGRDGAPVEPRPFAARLWPAPPLSVADFVDPGSTPGRVGICLSGGGSRAATGGMGQLRALRGLKTADGADLISQARALSTVSGGSWLGVTFTYLTEGTSDDDYLNTLVSDPGRFVPGQTAGHSLAETLDQLPAGNLGQALASRSFGPLLLALEVLLLHQFGKVPTPFLWQTAIALHVLKRYGLFEHTRHLVPSSAFSYDAATVARDIVGPNPDLADLTVHLPASGAGRSRRPFLVCNMAMFLREKGTSFDLLAPVVANPFATGISGAPVGDDFAGVMTGGGGITSFAFNSALTTLDPAGSLPAGGVTVSQTRPFSLMDIVGTSSAFYAEVLENLYASWRDDVDQLLDALLSELDTLIEWAEGALPGEHHALAMEFLQHPLLRQAQSHSAAHSWATSELKKWLDEVRDLTPEYLYWPVRDAAPAPELATTAFADGGDLENTGVASLLSYQDVERLISFVNPSTPLYACSLGAFDAAGNEIPGTRVLIDTQMPGLFGYQPWREGQGYRLYEGATSPQGPELQHNQVFPPAAFAELLRGLWAATGNSGDPAAFGLEGKATRAGVNLKPAILRQELEVLANPWFGVAGGRQVVVVWCYTTRVKAFFDALSPEVQQILGDFDDPSSFHHWPHYSTAETYLPPTAINLLSGLTAWCVANPENRETFLDLFRES